jgi:DNA-binding CsgD family transcriptional regulator
MIIGKHNFVVIKSLIFLLFCLCTRMVLNAQPLPHIGLQEGMSFTPENYQAGTQNWSIGQDKFGMIYFGNNHGLLQFDGSSWRIFPLPNRTIVRAVHVATDGRIFAGGQQEFGFFLPDETGSLTYHSLVGLIEPDQKNFEDVWRIFQDKDRIFFHTFRKVFIYENNAIQVFEPEGIYDLAFFINNDFYVLEWEKGLCRFVNNRLYLVPHGDFFKEVGIAALLPGSGNKILIATNNHGIFSYDGTNIKPWNTEVDQFLKESRIYCGIQLKNGLYAIGTSNNGLVILDDEGDLVQYFTRGKGLINRSVLSLHQDFSDNLWLGLDNGISMIKLNSSLEIMNDQAGLPGAGYTSYKKGSDLYFGTNTGLYHINVDEKKLPMSSFTINPINELVGQVWNVQEIKGDLLVSHHEGAFQLFNGKFIPISSIKGIWEFISVPGRADQLIAGYYNGLLLFEKSGGMWHFKNQIEGFNESSRIMERDDQGNIWIAHGYKGLYKVTIDDAMQEVQMVKFYGMDSGFPSNLFINIFRIKGKLYFAGETGLYTYNAATDFFDLDSEFTELFGSGNHVRKLVEDVDGNIWFSVSDNIGILKINQDGSYGRIRLLPRLTGRMIGGFEHFNPIDEYNVIIGLQEGFAHFRPVNKYPELHKFETVIRSVNIQGKTDSLIYGGYPGFRNQKVAAIFPYRNNNISFSFSSPFYDDVENNQYQFMLEGFEENWSAWTTKNEKEYTNLREGNYQFLVRTKNIYGDTSPFDSFQFTIKSPWYRSFYAYSGYGMMIFLLLGMTYRFQKRKYEKEKYALRKKSAEEIMHLRNEKLQSEISHKNKELATSTMHLIHKGEMLIGLKKELELIKKDKSNNQKVVDQLIKKIDQDIAQDGEWEQFEIHFDQVHENFLKKLRKKFPELTPKDLKLCAYLRMNLASKEIAPLLNISIRGVEISRYRLRKKLHLDHDKNLVDFMMNL